MRLILEAEMATSDRLEYLLHQLAGNITRYQRIEALVEISTLVSRLRDISTDEVFKYLTEQDTATLPAVINTHRRNLMLSAYQAHSPALLNTYLMTTIYRHVTRYLLNSFSYCVGGPRNFFLPAIRPNLRCPLKPRGSTPGTVLLGSRSPHSPRVTKRVSDPPMGRPESLCGGARNYPWIAASNRPARVTVLTSSAVS